LDVINKIKFKLKNYYILRLCSFLFGWEYISAHFSLSEKMIRASQDKVYWELISKHQTLSEDFIREFKDRVQWRFVSEYQILSENFIREFEDKVNWCRISEDQKLSNNFLIEFKERIFWLNYFYFQEADYVIVKSFILRTNYTNTKEFASTHLNDIQKGNINKMLSLKNLFPNRRKYKKTTQ
jgi:hypothetical protein